MRPRPLGQLLHRSRDRQRVEDVVGKPGPHRDVPAPPVFLDRTRRKRAVKILLQPDAQHFGKADGDVNPAGEVTVNLGRIQQNQQRNIRAVVIRSRQGPDRQQRRVCHHNLFEIPPHHARQPPQHVVAVKVVPRDQLTLQVGKPADGSLNQLREKGDEQRRFGKIPLGCRLCAVNIDQIAHRLKGVEGDSERQNQIRHPRAAKSRQHKAGILEHGKRSKSQDQPRSQNVPPPLFSLCTVSLSRRLVQRRAVPREVGVLPVGHALHQTRRQIGHRRCPEDEGHIARSRQEIEPVACRQQNPPAPRARGRIIEHQRCRREQEEPERYKLHCRPPVRQASSSLVIRS